MARISEFKFQLNGVDYKIPVNVGVDGVFKVTIPVTIAHALNIRSELREDTLSD